MSRKITRRMSYTPEFRADAVAAASSEPVPVVAKRLGINPSTLWNWKAAAANKTAAKPTSNGEFKRAIDTEIERLDHEIQVLADKRDALEMYKELT